MAIFTRNQLLVSAGGDVLQKYGTWVRRLTTPGRGGEGLKEIFSRSTVGLSLQSDGYYLRALANASRAEWSIDPVTGILRPYLLLEGLGNTNLFEDSNDIGAGAPSGPPWFTNEATVGALVALDPARGSTFAPVYPSTANVSNHYVAQGHAITAGEYIAGRIGINGTGGLTGLLVQVNTAGTNGFLIGVDLALGTVNYTAVLGTGILAGAVLRALGAGSYELCWWGSCNDADASVNCFYNVYPNGTAAKNQTAYIGGGPTGPQLCLWGATFERNGANPLPPTSQIVTGAGSGTRAAESCAIPFAIAPRPLAIYAKFLELGGLYGAAFANLWAIGEISPTLPAEAIVLRNTTGPARYNIDHVHPQTSGEVFSGGTIAPTFGQQVEVLGTLYDDGSVQIFESLQGAAEIAGARSGANPNGLGPVWGNNPVIQLAGAWSAVGLISLKVIDNTNGAIGTLAQARAVPV